MAEEEQQLKIYRNQYPFILNVRKKDIDFNINTKNSLGSWMQYILFFLILTPFYPLWVILSLIFGGITIIQI